MNRIHALLVATSFSLFAIACADASDDNAAEGETTESTSSALTATVQGNRIGTDLAVDDHTVGGGTYLYDHALGGGSITASASEPLLAANACCTSSPSGGLTGCTAAPETGCPGGQIKAACDRSFTNCQPTR
jgi:hypothetical protein